MLFGYPVAAAAENWLHDCVLAAVVSAHQYVDSGKRLPNWPEIIPLAHREKLSKRTGLKSRISNYTQVLRRLDFAKRQSILNALIEQNKIEGLLARQCECSVLGELPEDIRVPAKSLFTYTFGLLTDLGIRRRHYEAICNGIPIKICPFCGCENLEAPDLPQEDLDHYLPRSKYPFAAANLRNLAPMGGRCNSSYKRTQDPLRGEDGVRRLAFDPFLSEGVTISFNNSLIDELTTGPIVSEWVIDFYPASESVETWDNIFDIRKRWTKNFLDEATIEKWLGEFRSFCKYAKIQITLDEDLVEAINRYQGYLSECGFSGQAFLKAAAFQLLHRKCEAGSERLLPLFRDLTAKPS